MLKKRIIPCLDIQNGRTVKGVNFKNLQEVGDAVTLAQSYCEQGADELVFLDITASVEKRKTLLPLVEKVGETINIPFTVGGGIGSIEDVELLLQAGADKVSLNSSAVRNPQLIEDLAQRFGSQCIVLAIDALRVTDEWKVSTLGGRKTTERSVIAWAQEGANRGVGEILLTSMQQDGLRTGFDLPLTSAVAAAVNLPLIASGGAGALHHFKEVFQQTGADAALAASIFHYKHIAIPQLKNYLQQAQIPIR